MTTNQKIKLGDKVRDKVTGYEGIAVARTQFLNDCVQYMVARKLKKDQDLNIQGDPSFDELILEVVEKKVIFSREYQDEEEKEKTKEKRTTHHNGGATKFMSRMKGY